jgi:hypothetical protein
MLLRIPNFYFIGQRLLYFLLEYFDDGFPIYSAKAIRVRFGYHKNQMEMNSEPFVLDSLTHKMLYNWTYTSPIFPMSQVSCSTS